MKLLKKLAGIILAFAMVMAMPSVVMAESNGSITIEGAHSGHTFEAYQIFAGDLSTDGKTLSNIVWGDGINEADKTTLGDAKEKAKLLNETNAAAFADEISKHLSTIKKETNTYADGKYVINGLAPGYYLVKDKDDTVPENETYTKFILKVVGTATATVKSAVPTSQKKVKDTNDTTGNTTEWQDSADYDIGDEVPFQLTGTVASNYADYKGAYKLVFHDKESKGLTFNKNSVVVKVDGKKITSGYKVNTELVDGCTFEVVFENLKSIVDVHANSNITVEYTSKLNDQANIGSLGNPNKMCMEFSNNPNVEQDGSTTTTPWDTVIVFTYKTVIDKVDSSNQPLKGAAFKLEKVIKDEENKVIKEFTVETDRTSFEFTGLDDGEYILTETATPEGYNTIDPITFKINAAHNVESDNPTLKTLNGEKVNGEITFTNNLDAGSLTAKVVNNKGSELPSTGGMGTTILYAAGTIMILVAGVFLVMQKKAEN